MDILYERVAGLDVHKDTVVACVRILAEGNTRRECRTFATTTDQLMGLRTWLEECRCTQGGDGGDRGLLDAGVPYPWRGIV
jgi:transposase